MVPINVWVPEVLIPICTSFVSNATEQIQEYVVDASLDGEIVQAELIALSAFLAHRLTSELMPPQHWEYVRDNYILDIYSLLAENDPPTAAHLMERGADYLEAFGRPSEVGPIHEIGTEFCRAIDVSDFMILMGVGMAFGSSYQSVLQNFGEEGFIEKNFSFD